MFRLAVLALFSCVLSACGGGGGGGGGGGTDQPPSGNNFQVTLDRTALTFQATEGGTPPSQTLVATWTGTPPDPVYISATVEGTGIAPTIPTLITSSSATATVSVASGLVAGNYSGRINFLVCRDAACTQRVGGSPLPVSYTLNVAPRAATSDFTLSTNTVAFSARRSGPAPASYAVQVQLADPQPPGVGLAYVTSAPDWMLASVNGQAPYTVTLTVMNTNKAIGTHTAVLAVSTLDAADKILKTQNVTITLRIVDEIRAFASPPPPPFVLGSSASSAASSINVVADPMRNWTVASNTPWVTPTVSNGTGNAAVNVQIDAATLDIGTHTGNVTIVNASDPADTVTIPVTATVIAPTISVAAGPVVIGGADGLSTDPTETFALSINTGTNSFPWSATATTTSGDAWLTLPAASGQVSSAATHITIHGDASLVDPGRYTGTVTVQVNVRGHIYSRSVPVGLNEEGHWLQASAHGASFSSFPGRSVLSRSVQITSTRGRTDVPWSATSNVSWLSVTASGTTGGTLQLTVDPAGLQQDTTHIATVTIASSDPEVLNEETIRVAFLAGATDPQDLYVNGWQPLIVANPVEPWVYTNGSGWNGGNYINDNTIRIYNVYTGALVNSWTTTFTNIGEMTMSSDGTLLFVSDWGSQTVVALDAQTGATVRSYAYTQYLNPSGLGYIDVGARPTLVVGNGQIFDVTSGTRHSSSLPEDIYRGRLSFAVDPLNRHLYVQDQGLSASSLYKFSITRTAMHDDGVVLTRLGRTSGGENGQDVCVSNDGSRVYTANGAPYVFAVFNASAFQFTRYLPGDAYPHNVACGWNGTFVGGADAYYATTDVWVYRPDGSAVTQLRMADATYTSLAERSLVLSGDNSRLIGAVKGPGIGPIERLVFKSIPAP